MRKIRDNDIPAPEGRPFPSGPPDECERWMEEEYFPKILPSFPPFEHVDRTATVTFEDHHGRRCVIGAAEITVAFLTLVDHGLLPPVTDDWRNLVPGDMHPGSMQLRPEHGQDTPAQHTAQFITLHIHQDAFGCPCCGTRAYALFRTPVCAHKVSERHVVAAMHQLALANAAPPLSRYWQTRMEEVYEPRCKADPWQRSSRESEL